MEEKTKGKKLGEDVIVGRNAVSEALRSGRAIDSLYLARGNRTGSLSAIAAKAKQMGIAVKETDPKKLDYLCGGANHQGVAAVAAAHEYAQVEDLFRLAEERGESPFFYCRGRVGGSPQSRGDPAYRRMCRRARGDHPAAALRRADVRCRESFRWGRGIRPGGARDEYHRHARGAETARRMDLCRRYGRSGLVRRRLQRPLRHRHRIGGIRREPSRPGKIGFYRVAADAREDQLPERFGCLWNHLLRSGPPARGDSRQEPGLREWERTVSYGEERTHAA